MASILVVDDEPHATRLLKLRLEGDGHGVEIASDGEEAMKRLLDRQFDVLITDICMPRVTGRELCEAVRKRWPGRRPMIFAVSSRPEDEFRSWTRELVNIEFIEKPVSVKRLAERITERMAEESSRGGSIP